MKKIKNKELNNMDDESLGEKLLELYKEKMKINAQVATGTTPKNPGELKQIKKNIARIKNLQNKRKLMPK